MVSAGIGWRSVRQSAGIRCNQAPQLLFHIQTCYTSCTSSNTVTFMRRLDQVQPEASFCHVQCRLCKDEQLLGCCQHCFQHRHRAVHTLHVWIATELTAVEGLAAVFSSKIALTLVGLRTNRANTLPSLTAMLDKYRYDCSQQREHRTPLIADFSRQYQLTVERCFDAAGTA